MASPWLDLPASIRVRDGNDQLVFLGQQTMANSWPVVIANNQTPIPVTISPIGASSPTIANVSAPTAGTEVSYAFPAKTTRFTLNARTPAKVQFSFTSGQSGTTFFTVLQNGIYSEDDLDLTGVTIYFQTNKASNTVEIVSWQHA